jgi:hypothetical protein
VPPSRRWRQPILERSAEGAPGLAKIQSRAEETDRQAGRYRDSEQGRGLLCFSLLLFMEICG